MAVIKGSDILLTLLPVKINTRRFFTHLLKNLLLKLQLICFFAHVPTFCCKIKPIALVI